MPIIEAKEKIAVIRSYIYHNLPGLCREDKQLQEGRLETIHDTKLLRQAILLISQDGSKASIYSWSHTVRDLVRQAAVEFVIQSNPKERRPYLTPAQRRLLLSLEDNTPTTRPFTRTLDRLIELRLVTVTTQPEALVLTDAGRRARQLYQESP